MEWRSVCGVTCWPRRDGQVCSAVGDGPVEAVADAGAGQRTAPDRLGNTGLSGSEVIWSSQARSSAAVVCP